MTWRSRPRQILKWAALTGSLFVTCLIVGSHCSVLNVEIHATNSYELGIGAGRLYLARLSPFSVQPARPRGWGIRRGEDHWDYRPWQARFFVDVPLWPVWVLLVPITVIMFRRDRPAPLSVCRNCGYNLTGNVSGRCPECGKECSTTAAPRASANDRRGDIRRDRVIWLGVAAPVVIVGTLYLGSYLLWLWHLSYVVNTVNEVGQPVVESVYRFRETNRDWPADHQTLWEFLGEPPGADYYHSNAGPTVSVKVGRESSATYIFDQSHPDHGWTYGETRLDVPPPTTTQPSSRSTTQPTRPP